RRARPGPRATGDRDDPGARRLAVPGTHRLGAADAARDIASRSAGLLASAIARGGTSLVSKIQFGTDGWRAGIADAYSFDAVRVCAQSVAEWVQKTGGAGRGIVIGFDRRFRSEHFAAAAAEVVAAHGIHVF